MKIQFLKGPAPSPPGGAMGFPGGVLFCQYHLEAIVAEDDDLSIAFKKELIRCKMNKEKEVVSVNNHSIKLSALLLVLQETLIHIKGKSINLKNN